MNLLLKELMLWIVTFAPLFSKPVWESAIVLLVGAIVALGKRTISAILQVMDMQHEPHFQNYHRVLNRAVWSRRQASRFLLQHLGTVFVPIRWVLVKDPNGKFEPQVFLSTDINATAQQILLWFRQRWQVEVTFEEIRAHLGVETQQQWSDLAILRTTPALLALFSIVVLWAHQLQSQIEFSLPQSAWYNKSIPTFVDALALVRQRLWQTRLFQC